MKYVIPAYRIFPLGDEGVTVDFGNVVDPDLNRLVLALAARMRTRLPPGIQEVAAAYASLTVYFDRTGVITGNRKTVKTAADHVYQWLEQELHEAPLHDDEQELVLEIPVCYDPAVATDLPTIAAFTGLDIEEIIEIHSRSVYRVYMLGFLPGFPYLGDVDARIRVPRKAQPATVMPGSVGIAGAQTGIYPFKSPGGWMIVGRTPLLLFDQQKEQPVLLQPGNRVRFIPISYDEFAHY